MIYMDWEKELYCKDEQPLDILVEGYSNTSVFRTVAFVGDSLSSGEFESRDAEGNPGYHDMFEYSWGQYIARKNGFLGYNFSRGGMTAKEYIQSFGEQQGFWNKDKAAQAYVIALGLNDIYGWKQEPGSADDIDPDDWQNNKDTFAGWYAKVVSRYKEISPQAKFFFVTPPRSTTQLKNGAIAEAVRSLADYFNAYVIDLYKYGPVYDDRFCEQFFLYGHMSPSGYILTAKLIDSYIDYIIRHNPDDFRRVGFINTGLY